MTGRTAKPETPQPVHPPDGYFSVCISGSLHYFTHHFTRKIKQLG